MIESLLYAAIAPFVLLLISTVWSYPAPLEEVVKWAILRLGGKGVQVGVVFGLSEAVLFTINAWSSGEWGAIGLRLLLTVPMHALTGYITGVGIKSKWSWVYLIMAMAIHYLFNYWVGLMA